MAKLRNLASPFWLSFLRSLLRGFTGGEASHGNQSQELEKAEMI